jgi:hypothetical protein
MIEHIKKFQEEFKAKYGVEASIDINVHLVANSEVLASKIVEDNSNHFNSSKVERSLETETGRKFKTMGFDGYGLGLKTYFDVVEEENSNDYVSDTMVWK